MSRKPEEPAVGEKELTLDQVAPEAQPEPEEFRIVKGEEELTVHRSALNHYLSGGWKRA